MNYDASQFKRCPVCGENYQEHQAFCSFCKFELNRNLWELGNLNPDELKNHQNILDDRKQQFYKSALVVSWYNGSLDENLLKTITSGLYEDGFKDQASLFEDGYRKNFLPLTQKDVSVLLGEISALAMGQKKDIFILDDGPDQITLVHISNSGDRLVPRFKNIVWRNFVKDLPKNSNSRNLALVGGYIELDKKKLTELIRSSFTELDAPTKFPTLICSRLFDGKHSEIIRQAAQDAGCQIQTAPYLIGDCSDFKSYLESWLVRAPLRQELALVAVRVASDGKVTLHYPTLFPAGIFLDLIQTKQVSVRSLNQEDSQIELAVVQRQDNKRPSTLLEAWKVDLSYGEEVELTFELKDRTTVVVPRAQKTSSLLNLSTLIANIPTTISTNTPSLDLVLVIDTIASPTVLQQRCEAAKATLRELEKLTKGDNLRYMVIAYGDHYPIGNNVPKGWPRPVRKLGWKPLEEIEIFLDSLNPTPVENCDFESALDEALQELTQLDWRENVCRCVFSIGQRPPHPKKPIPGLYQAGSRKGLDWKDLVKDIHERIKAYTLVLVCPIEWPGVVPKHAKFSADEFWGVFSNTKYFDFEKIEATETAQKIWNSMAKTENRLNLPVLI